ncbi:hypothetical protein [Micromonospora sp. DPT]|uniref:hypothetical protein n=1 Tax=Micromonospora sp. DPT TaxID=3142975 RepID=UPI00320B6EE2
MTINHRHLTRALMIAALAAGVWTASELADGDTAHADTKPGVAAGQGGQLGRDLPRQASDRAEAVVAKATAEPTPEPTDDQAETPAPPREDPPPADKPEPEDPPVDDRPTDPVPPVELPPVEVPAPTPTDPAPVPVELPPTPPAQTPLPPLPVETPPAPAPAAETPPAPRTDPLPVPPVEVPLPAAAAPGPLPVVVGPVPAAEPPAGNVVEQLVAELTAGTEQPICADDPDDARRINRDALRALLAGRHHKPTPTVADSNPCRPQLPAVSTTGAGQVKPPPPSAADLIVAIFTGSHVPPVLGRLEHARARSTIPASRRVAIEPGPA